MATWTSSSPACCWWSTRAWARTSTRRWPKPTDYLHGLKDHELPRYLITSDFARIAVHDLQTKQSTTIALAELPQRIELFDFISGWSAPKPLEQDPVNRRAAELMAQLHDELKASGYDGHALEHYLVRLLFCLFADDTGIFEKQVFYDFIEGHTREDGSDVGPRIAELFQLLNTPEDKRPKNLDDRWRDFHYINGKLFQEILPIATWDGRMRATLLECAGLDWTNISPAIFGAMFQGVMDPKQRRDLGAHYTSEKNILKLIKPLFLDELWDEFNRVKGSKAQLEKFHQKLAGLKFLDPACGCGNFLVITYRELRRLELEVLKVKLKGQQVTNVQHFVNLDVDQFYGIEIEEFPAQIAQVALWLTDHQMNMAVSNAFGDYMVRIPLRHSATIHHGNALRVDWQSLLKEGERYDYILGNPPFIGHQWRDDEQQKDVETVWGSKGRVGRLDFVTCWFKKAADLIKGSSTQVAFVSTNSITQGEQPAIIWSVLNAMGMEKTFAYRTFKWSNEARGIAQVHVVIIGFISHSPKRRLLFEVDQTTGEAMPQQTQRINGYLLDAAEVLLESRGEPIWFKHPINKGSQPTDGGGLILEDDELDALKRDEPDALKWVRPYMGAQEFISGNYRHCLWLKGISPIELKALPLVREHLQTVVAFRQGSPTASVRAAANTPTVFTQDRQPTSSFLVVPEVSSENRKYIPIGFVEPMVVPANTVQIVPNADLLSFGFVQSQMHMAWVGVVCGRMKSDFRYTPAVYNNFPWPESPTAAQKQAVEAAAQGVLDARANHKGASLADLYDPLTMPPDLVKAHQALDKAVDKCYRAQPFANDAKRVEYLFELYEKYTAGLLAQEKPKRKKNQK